MADAAVEFLLENLKQLLLYNGNLIDGINDEVESLYKDLSLFRAFLKESADHSRHQNEVLIKELLNVVYEAEDTVDTFVAHNAWKPIKKALHASDSPPRKPNRKALHAIFDYPPMMAKEIELIQRKLKDIYEKNTFGFEVMQVGDGSSDRGQREKELLPPPIIDVVGLKDEAEKVIKLLTQGPDDLQVISIVLGRTTLARMIYRDPKTRYGYWTCIWVYISQEYSRKEVFLNILGTLTNVLTDDYRKMSADSLAQELRKRLERIKYLIVMDDVWTEEAWDDLKTVFPNNNSGSRILITSRIPIVDANHNLLFMALGRENCPYELVKDRDWWEKVAMDQQKLVDKFIDLSYNNLPYHLKACFVYFGMFPEGLDIPVWKLIRLWVAEGFIQRSRQDMSPEDIAEEYLEDLVNRNLVMAVKFRSNGKIKTCRVHDMLHDFCKKIAAEDNFFQEIKQGDVSSNPEALERCRRLCIHSSVLSYLSSKPMGPRVRSFLCFSDEETKLQAEHVSSIPRAFKLLRVLDARSVTLTHFPKDLTRLVHLKYLVLSCDFKALPHLITSLYNLQTLVVITKCKRTLDVRANLWTMIQLRHVKMKAAMALPFPDSKSMVTTLQTLSMISPECCTEDVFGRAPNLKVLGIRGELNKLVENKENGNKMLFDSFRKLSHLESLKLLHDVFPRAPSEGRLSTLPPMYMFPPRLRKLTLSGTWLDWNDMSTLGMLENLEILQMKDRAFIGELWQPDEGGFRALKVLHIEGCNLVNWNAKATHFPRLRSLFIRDCSKLVSIPLGFADILSLELIDLCWTTASSAASAKEIQETKKGSGGGVVFKLSIFPPELR